MYAQLHKNKGHMEMLTKFYKELMILGAHPPAQSFLLLLSRSSTLRRSDLMRAHLCRLHRVFGGGVGRVRATHVSGKQALLSLCGCAALVLRATVRARLTFKLAHACALLLIELLPVTVQVLAEVRVGVVFDAPDPARLGSNIHDVR